MDRFFKSFRPPSDDDMDDPFREFRVFFGGLDDDDDNPTSSGPTFGGAFGFSRDMFREMDELMQEIMTSGRGGRYRPGMREDDPDRNFGSDMRNRMLKDPNDPFWRREYRPTEKSAEKPPDLKKKRFFPDITTQPKGDTDLDASIAADPSQLDYLLRQEQEKDSPVMNQADGSLSHDMTYSHSSTTFSMSTDGSYERRQTTRRRDVHGNEEETVIQSDENETRTVTTYRHSNGEEETTEMINRNRPEDFLSPIERRYTHEENPAHTLTDDLSNKPSTILRRFWNSIWSS
ncbi:uncharacterized protein LOC134191851 isoform X2 [Corticium candelabrum]|uniref:uncharacterized protein LOC134191851 isoform X2 n=1 Tax=Corticium candelabrum TaxID=121492 RepID=UPI002E258AD0|nr:uncharacterized protein LOC134191851 isoform X2 [Corticium candelabrum]